MVTEDLEFQISQYVDGTLSAAERSRIENLVLSDPHAGEVLADYKRLNRQLAQLRVLPNVDWERFTEQVSGEIERSDAPAVAGRIGFSPARRRFAAALLVTATGLIVTRLSITHHPMVAPRMERPSVSIVTGPQAEVPEGPAVQDVSVGPSPALAARDSRYGEGVIGRGPSKVVIIGALTQKRPSELHLH